MTAPDEQLIAEFQASRSPTAFDQLVARHLETVRNTAYRMVLCKATADDVTQDVFVKVFQHASSFRNHARFSTWLYRIVINTANEHLRRKRRTQDISKNDGHVAGPEHDRPEQRAMGNELVEKIEHAVAQLSPKLRSAVVLTLYRAALGEESSGRRRMHDGDDALENPPGPQAAKTAVAEVFEIMNDTEDHQLDTLLQQWAGKTASSPEELESLRNTIAERMDAAVPPAIELASSPSSHGRWPVVVGAMTLAAVLLVAFGLWLQGEPNGTKEEAPTTPTYALRESPPPLSVRKVPMSQQTRLLKEFQDLFGPDLVWIVERDGRADVGLIDPSSPAATSRPDRFIAVRLVLWARPVSGGDWNETEVYNVLAGQEELVQVAPTSNGTAPLALWIYPLDDKMVSIDLHYQPAVPTSKRINQSIIQPLGECTNICGFKKDGVEYRLYQTADLITGDDLG